MSIIDRIPSYPGFELLSSKIYVSIVDSTGSQPEFCGTNIISPNSLSVEFLVYSKFINELDQWVDEFIGTYFYNFFDNVPLSCFAAQDSTFLRSMLASVTVPLTIHGAYWSPNMTTLTSDEPLEPLGNMIDRLIEVGNRIVQFHKARAQSVGQRLRMLVAIGKVNAVSSSVYNRLYHHLGDDHHCKLYWLHSVLEAPRNAIDFDFETVIFQGSENITCAICLDDLKIGSRIPSIPCFHKFHVDCLRKLKINTCPICRSEV